MLRVTKAAYYTVSMALPQKLESLIEEGVPF
jgi:hypothetical protein